MMNRKGSLYAIIGGCVGAVPTLGGLITTRRAG